MAGYDFFEKILFEMTLYAVEHNHGLKFTMQTNGTLLDDKMAALLDKYNVLVSFSFDGIANRASRRYKEPKFVNDIKTGLYIIGPLTIDNLIKDYEIRKANEQNFSCQ
jgi:MoaA/NifB/PqqE/SkfB family radical SAM enzyme